MLNTFQNFQGILLEDTFNELGECLENRAQLKSIERFIHTQYGDTGRVYYTVPYLNRLSQALSVIMNMSKKSGNFKLTPKAKSDILLAALFHKVYLGQRAQDNAINAAQITKSKLEEFDYKGSQRVATIVTLTDPKHFPYNGDTHGMSADILRDAIMVEMLYMEDKKQALNMFKDMSKDLRTDTKSTEKRYLGWFEDWDPDSPPFALSCTNQIFGAQLMERVSNLKRLLNTPKEKISHPL